MTIFGWIVATFGRRGRIAAFAVAGALFGLLRLFLGWQGRYVLVFAALAIGVVYLGVMRRMPLRGFRGLRADDPESKQRFLAENWPAISEFARRNGVPPERIAEAEAQVFEPGRNAE